VEELHLKAQQGDKVSTERFNGIHLMFTLPNSTGLLKGGIVLLDSDSSMVVVRTSALKLSTLQHAVDRVLCGLSSAKMTTMKGFER
jgi:hypothetical protein